MWHMSHERDLARFLASCTVSPVSTLAQTWTSLPRFLCCFSAGHLLRPYLPGCPRRAGSARLQPLRAAQSGASTGSLGSAPRRPDPMEVDRGARRDCGDASPPRGLACSPLSLRTHPRVFVLCLRTRCCMFIRVAVCAWLWLCAGFAWP